MAQDEKRRLDADIFNEGTEALLFPALKDAVLQALESDGQSAWQAREIDVKAFIPEQLAPLAEGHATQQPRPN